MRIDVEGDVVVVIVHERATIASVNFLGTKEFDKDTLVKALKDAGIGEGLGVGDNTRAAVMSRGLAELTRLGVVMGAQPTTFAGLAGMGDLIATCMSHHSRNRAVGEQLGKGRRLDDILSEMHMVAEGVKTASVALELAEHHCLDLPICGVIDRVVKSEIEPSAAYWGLTPAGHEADPG